MEGCGGAVQHDTCMAIFGGHALYTVEDQGYVCICFCFFVCVYELYVCSHGCLTVVSA